MKTVLPLLLVIGLISLARLSFAAGEREAKQFKGVELYSWQHSSGEWQFALLPGTNGLKSRQQIRELKYRIEGVAALEAKLARLASGESVAWITGILDSTPPDKTMVDEIVAAASKAGVHVFVTHADEPANTERPTERPPSVPSRT